MMPQPSFWSAWRIAWNQFFQLAAAATAAPPCPEHIQVGAVLHCYTVGMVRVAEIDQKHGLCWVQQPRGQPWTVPYTALSLPNAAELFGYQAEIARRTRPPRPAIGGAIILQFPRGHHE
ncbi:hypothetical protein VZ95_14510 [Elstera litoralis]|uniref:Uncharacterized protein n=1 Tax=Elstera litoralis TaxID=552518 RepID=A0A0F3ITL4_9PROT|nr:hypothetical protein [Elstera litoralis]KJV08949.1 hypothetical protein VZ95_14510 [Elstera litoralis]